jgi:hypothetical protein
MTRTCPALSYALAKVSNVTARTIAGRKPGLCRLVLSSHIQRPPQVAAIGIVWHDGIYMSQSTETRVFVPAGILTDPTGLEPASADDSFFVVGVPGRHELPGFLVPVGDLEDRGIPRSVAREVAMIVSLRSSEHMILLSHEGGVWELLVQTGKGLPDTYTFKV